jgi:hypothetical protein
MVDEAPPREEGPPPGSKIGIKESGADELHILIPPVGANFRTVIMIVAVVFTIGFGIGWIRFTRNFREPFPAFGLIFTLAGIVPLLFGLAIGLKVLFAFYGKTGIYINTSQLALIRELFGRRRQKSVPLEKISDIEIGHPSEDSPRLGRYISIKHGWRSLDIGEGLSDRELTWLKDRIEHFIKKKRS